jgi:hypothetical protein
MKCADRSSSNMNQTSKKPLVEFHFGDFSTASQVKHKIQKYWDGDIEEDDFGSILRWWPQESISEKKLKKKLGIKLFEKITSLSFFNCENETKRRNKEEEDSKPRNKKFKTDDSTEKIQPKAHIETISTVKPAVVSAKKKKNEETKENEETNNKTVCSYVLSYGPDCNPMQKFFHALHHGPPNPFIPIGCPALTPELSKQVGDKCLLEEGFDISDDSDIIE